MSFMAAMKLAFFFFTLSTLLEAYHARHLHDGFKTTEVIQMVTGEEKPQSPRPPPSQSSSQEITTYGLDDPNASPSQGNTVYGAGKNLKGPLPGSETIYGGDNPKALLLLKVAPLQGETVYGGDKLEGSPDPPIGPPPEGTTIYGRVNLKAPPPSKLAPSRSQTTYTGDNRNSNSPTIYAGVGVRSQEDTSSSINSVIR